jgi:hypothetical protein
MSNTDPVLDAYNKLEYIFHDLDCLLAGAYQAAGNAPDRSIATGLLFLAQQKITQGKHLVKEVQGARKDPKKV